MVEREAVLLAFEGIGSGLSWVVHSSEVTVSLIVLLAIVGAYWILFRD